MIQGMRSSLILLFLSTSIQAYNNYELSAPAVSCPSLADCYNPCWDECDQETCEMSVGTIMQNGIECETCPKFVKCHPVHRANGQQQQLNNNVGSGEQNAEPANNFGSGEQVPQHNNFGPGEQESQNNFGAEPQNSDPLPGGGIPDMNGLLLPQGQTAPPPCPFITCPSDPCFNVQCDFQNGEVCNPVIERFFPNNGNPCSDCPVPICEVPGDRIFGGGGVRPPVSPPSCPIPSCADPCTECRQNGGECTLGPISTFISEGRECPGCPTFGACEQEEQCPVPGCTDPCEQCPFGHECIRGPPSTFVTDAGKVCEGCPTLQECIPPVCPVNRCANPCAECFNTDACDTRPTTFPFQGLDCPGCEALVECFDEPPPPPPTSCCAGPEPYFCGAYGCACCSDGQFYQSQNECQYKGLQLSEPCYAPQPQPQPQEVCGPTLCDRGQVCCNESCGICSEPQGFCTQQFCQPTFNNDNFKSSYGYNDYGSNYKYGSYRNGGEYNNNNLRARRGKGGGKGMMNMRK